MACQVTTTELRNWEAAGGPLGEELGRPKTVGLGLGESVTSDSTI